MKKIKSSALPEGTVTSADKQGTESCGVAYLSAPGKDQDRHCIHLAARPLPQPASHLGKPPLRAFGVFDGHGPTAEVAKHCADHLHDHVAAMFWDSYPTSKSTPMESDQEEVRRLLKEALTKAYSKANEEVKDLKFGIKSGTTATSVFITNAEQGTRDVHIAWVGDSRCLMMEWTPQASGLSQTNLIPMTADHRPECEKERNRIKEFPRDQEQDQQLFLANKHVAKMKRERSLASIQSEVSKESEEVASKANDFVSSPVGSQDYSGRNLLGLEEGSKQSEVVEEFQVGSQNRRSASSSLPSSNPLWDPNNLFLSMENDKRGADEWLTERESAPGKMFRPLSSFRLSEDHKADGYTLEPSQKPEPVLKVRPLSTWDLKNGNQSDQENMKADAAKKNFPACHTFPSSSVETSRLLSDLQKKKPSGSNWDDNVDNQNIVCGRQIEDFYGNPGTLEESSAKEREIEDFDLDQEFERAQSYVGRFLDRSGRPTGALRVISRAGLGLAVTRALGDWDGARSVIPQPEFSFHRVQAGRGVRFVIASDGLWDVLTNTQVCQLAAPHLLPEDAAAAIITEARYQWKKNFSNSDDTTIMVLDIQPESSHLSSYPYDPSFAASVQSCSCNCIIS